MPKKEETAMSKCLKGESEVKKKDAPAEGMVILLLSHSSGLWSKEISLNASGSYSSGDITAPNIDGRINIYAIR